MTAAIATWVVRQARLYLEGIISSAAVPVFCSAGGNSVTAGQ